jgi:allantoinase
MSTNTGHTTVIHGGTLVTSDGPVRADLVLRGEVIAAITADAGDVPDAERIDASGLIVVPGGIDAHTHFKDPDPEMIEGFDTGSAAGLAGGVTSAVEMPQATPTATTGAHIRQKRERIAAAARIDVALWGGAIGQPAAQLQEMLDEGVVAFKSFMTSSSPAFPRATDPVLLETFQFLADKHIPYGIHAENEEMMQAGIARMQAAGRKDPLAHAESRGPLVETVAVQQVAFLAELTGGWLYVCHCASAGAYRVIQQARARGVRVSVETCPQYLALDTSDLEEHGPFARCAPAFRERAEVERIWESVADGTVDVVSSDHCGYSMESKLAGLDDIWQAPLGCSGIQTMYPAVFDEMVNKRGLGLTRFVAVTATNPAKIFSLYPRKGAIQVGSDADLAFYDPGASWTVHGADMLHRNKWTPFEGKTIGASVVRTMLRGRTVFDRAQPQPLLGQPGDGRFLPRGYGATRAGA